MTFEMTTVRVLLASILTLFVGWSLTRRLEPLRRFSIPPAVSGGIVVAILIAVFESLSKVDLQWDLTSRDALLLVFFSGVGLSAKLSRLKAGGSLFMRLAILVVVFLVLQNLVGAGVALLIGRHPAYGLVCGSMAFAGGHGTAITWGEIAGKAGYAEVLAHGLAYATFGLIAGGVIGGPFAGRLIRRKQLAVPLAGGKGKEPELPRRETSVATTAPGLIRTIFVFGICVGLGAELNTFLSARDLVLPGFVTAMLAGVLLTNLGDRFGWSLHMPSIELASTVCLSLFLAMSLISLKLTHLSTVLLPVALALTAQVALAVVYARWAVFTFCGRNYEAAATATGFLGLTLGATPVGMANIQAVNDRFGPSPQALLVVPMIGAGVLDIANAFVIEAYLRFYGINLF